MLRLWSRVFRLLKCGITSHSSGLEALEEMRKQRFDIVITDLRMPDLSGHDLLEELQSDPALRGPKVFVCSGYVAPDADFTELGVERLIHKPFDIDTEVVYFRRLVGEIEANG